MYLQVLVYCNLFAIIIKICYSALYDIKIMLQQIAYSTGLTLPQLLSWSTTSHTISSMSSTSEIYLKDILFSLLPVTLILRTAIFSHLNDHQNILPLPAALLIHLPQDNPQSETVQVSLPWIFLVLPMEVPYHRNPLITRQSRGVGHFSLWGTFYTTGKIR